MNTLLGVLAALSMSSNPATHDANGIAAAQTRTYESQAEQDRRAAERQNNLAKDYTAARVNECIEGSKEEKNATLAAQMCVAAFYMRNTEFQIGLDLILQTVDPVSATKTRETLTKLIAVLQEAEKNAKP